MRKQSTIAIAGGVLLTALFAFSAFARDHHTAMNGTWTLAPTKSDFAGQPVIQTGTVTIDERQGNITVSRNFAYEGAGETFFYRDMTDSQNNATIHTGKDLKSKARWDHDVLRVTTTRESGATTEESYTLAADGSLMATGVEVITTAQSFLSGRVLAEMTNSSGQVQQITMWVGETGADMVGDVDTIQTIDVSQVSTYDVCFLNGPLTNAVFNDSTVVVGQRIFIGGSYASSVFTPTMISLRLQGVYGMFVPASVAVTNGNAGSFQLSNNGLVGYSVGGPVTVNTYNLTYFHNLTGLGQLQSTATAVPVVARGLLLLDPVSGNPEVYAGMVSEPSPSN